MKKHIIYIGAAAKATIAAAAKAAARSFARSIIALGAVAMSAVAANAQELKTSYFMEGSIPRYDMNAALTPLDGYVNMPFMGSIDVKFNNNFLNVENFIYPKQGGGHTTFLSSQVSAADFMKKMPQQPNFGVELKYNLLGFGNYSKKHDYFWSFGWNIRTMVDVNIPRDLFRTLKNFSNGYFSMTGLAIDVSAYNEFAFGFATPVGWENLVVGGRLKLLTGFANVEMSLDKAYLDVNQNYVRAEFGGTMRAANGLGFPMAGFGNKELGTWMSDMMSGRNFGNAARSWGAAVDLGAEMKFLDKRLKVSIGVNDLGFIYWNKQSGTVQGRVNDLKVEYSGYNTGANDGKGDFQVTTPEKVSLTETGSGSYSRRLVTTLNAGVEYSFFNNILGVGLLSHTRFGKYHTQS